MENEKITVVGTVKPTTEMMVNNTILVPDVEGAKKAMAAFERLKRELLIPGKDFVNIKGKLAITRAGFAKISTAFGISTQIIDTKRIKTDNDYIVHTISRAIAPNGRFSEAAASCSQVELKNAGREATIHVIESMSQTRSTSRAVANLVGGGTLAAEELSASEMEENKEDRQDLTPKITDAQKNLIKRIAKENNLEADIFVKDFLGPNADIDKITRKDASEVITQLKQINNVIE